jgi:acetylornithine deacetylase/succinyl-diaminopimelate desuccinylase-like protein
MAPFLREAADELRADCGLVCDTGMWDRETPAIAGSLRGLVSEEVIVTGASRDLHSGYFGGAAANPLHVPVAALAAMRDADGRITLDSFYAGVDEVPAAIRVGWDKLGRTPEKFLGPVGLSLPAGERGRSLAEMTWARPTAEINGLSGGYVGEGFKTIVPASATAKVSFRLVGMQDPEMIRSAFRSHVRAFVSGDCSVAFCEFGGAPAVRLDEDWPMLERARRALAAEWTKPTVVTGMGGSIPVVSDFGSILGMQCLLVGFGLPDDRIHAPNERYELASFHKGIRSWVRILQEIAR